jgi:NlpC/P60 family
MGRRIILLVFFLGTASATSGQSVGSAAHPSGPRPITRTEGRKILATVFTVDADSEYETDCSHLVHDVYDRAGFPYDYASSRDLYVGSAQFTRVRKPQAGDLVVWHGHVGIVIDPKEHSFFSVVRSGPDTQFYDSAYWRSRGAARFYRYMTEKPLRADRTLEARRQAEQDAVPAASQPSEDRPTPPSKPAPAALLSSSPAPVPSGPRTAETPREIVLQVSGKTPAPNEIAAAFLEMNQDSRDSLRAYGLSRLGKPIVVYRELRVSAVQIKGKRGTALVRIESLGAFPNVQKGSQPRLDERSLEFVKTKRGWAMSPIPEAVYVSREVALQSLSARLAELAQNVAATPEEEKEQRQIIRFLNVLVRDNSTTVSAQSH